MPRRRDWQLPHVEKLLEVNAALARLFLEAGSKLQTRAVHAIARRHASIHPDLAGRSGRRRLVRVATGGRAVLRR